MLHPSTLGPCYTPPPLAHATPLHTWPMLHPSTPGPCYTPPPLAHATPLHPWPMQHPSTLDPCYAPPSFKQTSTEKGIVDSTFFDEALLVLFEVSEKKIRQ